MNKPIGIFSIIVAAFGACFAHTANAAQTAPQPFSKYGNIQNVQNYSSNPFWNSNSPYNQRIPKAIYATGPDVNTGDCNRIVANLITSYCASNDCTNLRINDVRPQIMVQLSQLPGHNFATSCGGYIDGIFEQYQQDNGNTSTVIVKKPNSQIPITPFPTVTQKPTNVTAERTKELEQLQKTTTPTPVVTATAFPTTTADLSFTDRLANTSAGYQPYKDLSPYKTPKFEEESDYWARMKNQNKHLFCQEFPNDDACNSFNITYITYGGTTSDGCPDEYKYGAGATIACVPTRDKSRFIGWCTDAGLKNCASTQTIAPTEDTDKTFWAKWQCVGSSIEIDHECVCTDSNMDDYCRCTGQFKPDPSDSKKCVCANGKKLENNCQDNPPPAPSTCPDSHMTINPTTGKCECVGKYATDNGNPNKCTCRDTTKNIANDCEDNPPPPSTCPDSHMTINQTTGACECVNKYAPDSGDPNKCTCRDITKNIANDCEDNNDAKYAIFECRTDTVPDINVIGATSTPISSFACDLNRPNSVKKCFKDQYQNGHGLVSTSIEGIMGKVFPYGGFLTQYSVGRFPIKKLTRSEIDDVKTVLNNLSKDDRKKYCYSKRYWLVFFLEHTSDDKWLPIEAPFVLYDKSW